MVDLLSLSAGDDTTGTLVGLVAVGAEPGEGVAGVSEGAGAVVVLVKSSPLGVVVEGVVLEAAEVPETAGFGAVAATVEESPEEGVAESPEDGTGVVLTDGSVVVGLVVTGVALISSPPAAEVVAAGVAVVAVTGVGAVVDDVVAVVSPVGFWFTLVLVLMGV